MLKRIASILLLVMMIASTGYAQEVPNYQPALGTMATDYTIYGKVGNGNNETPGEWTIGETPPHLIEDAPILLFVPGLNNVAQIWWEGNNNMADAVYNAGYQAVFIQMHDAGGASADMWDNGQLLAEKIREISAHFNGKPITIIAYSKGGVDTQTALTYYGVSHLVDNVITLSSPHYGSELANLAYSHWASWLADLIGATGDGTYAMQTGYMENFRLDIDQEEQAYTNNYYTLGGKSWGTIFSATWFGGMYLSGFGQNDGVVTVRSSRLPGGQEVAIGNWNHTNIRTGMTLPTFERYMNSNQSNRLSDSIDYQDGFGAKSAINHWVVGGPLHKGKSKQIPLAIEEKVNEVTISVMTAKPLSSIKIYNPITKKLSEPKIELNKSDGEFFTGAYIHTFTLQQPEAGEYELEILSKAENAYLLLADYDTESDFYIKSRTKKQLQDLQAKNRLLYQIESNTTKIEKESLKVTYHITDTKNQTKTETIQKHGERALTQSLHFSHHDTVYNIMIEIEGKTKAGETFKRTMIDSLYNP